MIGLKRARTQPAFAQQHLLPGFDATHLPPEAAFHARWMCDAMRRQKAPGRGAIVAWPMTVWVETSQGRRYLTARPLGGATPGFYQRGVHRIDYRLGNPYVVKGHPVLGTKWEAIGWFYVAVANQNEPVEMPLPGITVTSSGAVPPTVPMLPNQDPYRAVNRSRLLVHQRQLERLEVDLIEATVDGPLVQDAYCEVHERRRPMLKAVLDNESYDCDADSSAAASFAVAEMMNRFSDPHTRPDAAFSKSVRQHIDNHVKRSAWNTLQQPRRQAEAKAMELAADGGTESEARRIVNVPPETLARASSHSAELESAFMDAFKQLIPCDQRRINDASQVVDAEFSLRGLEMLSIQVDRVCSKRVAHLLDGASYTRLCKEEQSARKIAPHPELVVYSDHELFELYSALLAFKQALLGS